MIMVVVKLKEILLCFMIYMNLIKKKNFLVVKDHILKSKLFNQCVRN